MAGTAADAPSHVSEPGYRGDRIALSLPLRLQLWIEVSLLIVIGLIMIYSASSIMPLRAGADKLEAAKSSAHYLYRQIFCILLGVSAMMVASHVPYRRYLEYSRLMLVLAILALGLVLIPGIGVDINHARRWFKTGFFLLQPAEYAKVVWVLFLTSCMVKKQDRIKKMGVGFWPHVFWCGVLALLLLSEPDFGTTFMIACLTGTMLFIGGVPFRHLFCMAPFAMIGFYKLVYKVPYRWERITAFRNPWTDPLDTGYQLIQAWIAVGSGGLFGKGLGASQQKLFYLPESFTDFILAVIGEETGLVGICGVSILFLCFFLTGLRISRTAPDREGALLAIGLTVLITLQALINMGVVLGLAPTKGLPLPFISYGGSALTANCVAVGILMNIAKSCDGRID